MNSKSTVPGGVLIAFEGVDGAGKTTQALAARDHFVSLGFEAVYLKEPTDGPVGRKLREMMVTKPERDPEEEFTLFLQDRQENVENNILPVLGRGGIVCIDRYYISSMAYQGALGLDMAVIKTENEKIAPRPDLALYFRLPLEQSLARILASRPEGQNLFELKEYQEKVLANFEKITDPALLTLDATLPVDALRTRVLEEIAKRVGAKQLQKTAIPK